jgi:hypothetical protein
MAGSLRRPLRSFISEKLPGACAPHNPVWGSFFYI